MPRFREIGALRAKSCGIVLLMPCEEQPFVDCEWVERLTAFRVEMEDWLARIRELEDDMRHDQNVARVEQEDWDIVTRRE